VRSFYHLAESSLEERSCQGTACFLARHLAAGQWPLGPAEPRVSCLGKCYASPASTVTIARPAVSIDARHGIVLAQIAQGGARTLASYRALGGYQALARALERPADELVRAIEASGLRGRGGAGFPTGKKLRAVAEQPASDKVVVANADEGDAGAYIDRIIIEDNPHCLVEGLLLAAHAVGARRGYVYLRREYPDALAILHKAAGEARAAGILDGRFHVEIVVGEGSYVCGEETALLDSIEGRRPMVRSRPPYPSQAGLFRRPTLVQNVETLANFPWIARHGADAYAALGFSQSRGTKVVSLNSLFRRPGLYEVEFGVPLRRIVDELGGGLKTGTLKGLMIGGPLAGVIPPRLLDTPFGFEELHAIGAAVGHGGVLAFDEHTSIRELVHHVFSFAAYESCGKCTPCRLGAARGEAIFADVLARGRASVSEAKEWTALVELLRATSLCGHGGGLAEFALSIVRHYPEELAACFG
jgi:NADH:ubiquinone oxidoreductase subunit F (NADH-binding)